MALCATAQDLYIGSFYVTSTTEEAQYGDGKDKWATRMPHIVDMFKYEQPDVLGLQSMTDSQLSVLSQRMTGYGKAGDILYNKSSVELDTCNVVEDMPEGCTGTWAKLRKGETEFYVFNICCIPTSAMSVANRIRTVSTALNPDNLPCFVVGYLGVSENNKTAYTRLTARFNDCYTSATYKSAEYGTVNNFDLTANHGTDRYDFVFASKDVTVKAYGQLQSGYLTKETDGTYKRRLLSTHFPVMAKVRM